MDRKQQSSQAILIKTHFRGIVMPIVQAAAMVFQELENDMLSTLEGDLQIIDAMEVVEGKEQKSPPPPRSG
jgi:hypothetical protein